MRLSRQVSSKTHDPFVIIQYFGGSLGLHVASLIILCSRYSSHEGKLDKVIDYKVKLVMFANITCIVGIIGKALLRERFASAKDAQDKTLAEYVKAYDAQMDQITEQVQKEKEENKAINEDGKEEKTEAEAQLDFHETMSEKNQEMLDYELEGTLRDFSSTYVLLDSIFGILPITIFLYVIFELICYILIVQYKTTGGNVYDRQENQSIKFIDQTTVKVGNQTLATDTGLVIDEFLPVFAIVLIDWLVNFTSLVIMLSLAFLYKSDYSPNDQIEEQQGSVQIITFFFNMTLQNMIIVGLVIGYNQMIPYDVQVFELKIDLVLTASFSLMMFVLFFQYLVYNKVYQFKDLDRLLSSNAYFSVFFLVTFFALVMKVFTCLLTHPFVVARNHYYPHTEAHSIAYTWIQFYFIETLVFLPDLGRLVMQYEAQKKQNASNVMVKNYVEGEQTPTQATMLHNNFMVDQIVYPFIFALFKNKVEGTEALIKGICENLNGNISNVDLDKFPVEEMANRKEELGWRLAIPDFPVEHYENQYLDDEDEFDEKEKEEIKNDLANYAIEADKKFTEEDERLFGYSVITDTAAKMTEFLKSVANGKNQKSQLKSLQTDILKVYPSNGFASDKFEFPLKFNVSFNEEDKIQIELDTKVYEASVKEFETKLQKYVEERDEEVAKKMQDKQQILKKGFTSCSLMNAEEDIKICRKFEDIPKYCGYGKGGVVCEICGKKEADVKGDNLFAYSDFEFNGQFFCQDCILSTVSDRYLELGESVYSASFVSMMTDTSKHPPQPIERLPSIQALFNTTQIVFILQVVIFMLLAVSNWNKDMFQVPTPSFLIMRMVTAFMFHIFALDDSREAYQKLKFLIRYPGRFEKKLRLSAYVLCVEQFLITMGVEFLNLMYLCKQENYEDLIMNYVALCGILAIDNDFMNIQKKNHKDVADWIENPDKHPEFKLYKDPLLHDKYGQSSFLQRTTFGIFKFIYKVIYFYITPIFVVWFSFIGYNYWQEKQILDKKGTIKLKFFNLTPINAEQIKKDYYGQMKDFEMYNLYVWMIFSVVFALIKVTIIQKNQNFLQKIISILLNSVYFMGIQFVAWVYLWPFWSGSFEIPSWLAWGYEIPITFGYLHMATLAMLWLSHVESIDKHPPFAGGALTEYMKYTGKSIAMKLVGAIRAILGTAGVIITAGFEWILWKIWILDGIWYFLYYCVFSFFYYPLILLVYCYTHQVGFLCLIGAIILSYCIKQALVGCGKDKSEVPDIQQPLVEGGEKKEE